MLHGAYCLGGCWLLFVIRFPLGIMNVAVIAVITLVIFAEKTIPWGAWWPASRPPLSWPYGAVVLAAPQVLPTFLAGGGTGATAGAAPMDMQNMPMPRSTATPARQ